MLALFSERLLELLASPTVNMQRLFSSQYLCELSDTKTELWPA